SSVEYNSVRKKGRAAFLQFPQFHLNVYHIPWNPYSKYSLCIFCSKRCSRRHLQLFIMCFSLKEVLETASRGLYHVLFSQRGTRDDILRSLSCVFRSKRYSSAFPCA